MKERTEKDYANFDYLSLTVKKESAEEVVASYGVFCWEEIERRADKQYSDILHITFKRVHKIENKDRLQYLQVEYESHLNKRSAIKIRKHYKSNMIISTALALLGCFLFGIIALVFFIKSTLSIVLGSVLIAIEAGLSVLLIYIVRKLRRKERVVFDDTTNKLNKDINKILAEAVCLTGEKL